MVIKGEAEDTGWFDRLFFLLCKWLPTLKNMKINNFHLESCKTRAKHEDLAKLLSLLLLTILSKID